MTYPAKKMDPAPAPPQKLNKPMAFRCEQCGKGLDKQYICDAKDPFKPDDDTRRCFKCAGVESLAELAKAPKALPWWKVYLIGAFTPVVIWMIGRLKGWW